MLNKREIDVLNILWKAGEPLMVTDIVGKKADLTQSTVTAVLRKLLDKGLVQVSGIAHSGRVLSRTYRPTEASRDCIRDDFIKKYGQFCDVISPAELCFEIIKNSANKDEIDKLKKILG